MFLRLLFFASIFRVSWGIGKLFELFSGSNVRPNQSLLSVVLLLLSWHVLFAVKTVSSYIRQTVKLYWLADKLGWSSLAISWLVALLENEMGMGGRDHITYWKHQYVSTRITPSYNALLYDVGFYWELCYFSYGSYYNRWTIAHNLCPYLTLLIGGMLCSLRRDKLVPLTVENDCPAFDFHYHAKKRGYCNAI